MAQIRKAKGRRKDQSPSGYSRLFGNPELGNLLSRVQGTVISAGSELEKLIIERCKLIKDFDKFITNLEDKTPGIFVATKKQIKASKLINTKFEPDLLAFDLVKRICYVIEVKDGDQFDTKKAEGERVTLQAFVTEVASTLPFSFRVYLCSFNARTKKEIYDGLKRKFPIEELLTGKELCDLLEIDYAEITGVRNGDQGDNIEHFVDELLNIPKVRDLVDKRNRNAIKKKPAS
ncbi:MAG: hypothetical protein WD740_00135 [Anaerolineales bacterium]